MRYNQFSHHRGAAYIWQELRLTATFTQKPSAAVMSEEAFLKAVDDSKVLKARPNTDDLGVLYGLYKQTIEGDVNTECPGFLDIIGKTKWKAWNSRKGLSKQDAREAYIKAVEGFKVKYGF